MKTTKPRQLQAIIFDVDGVLFDTEILHIRAWQKVLSGHGMQVDDRAMDKWVGRPCSEMADYYVRIMKGAEKPSSGEWIDGSKKPALPNGCPAETIYRQKEEELRSLLPGELRLMPGLEPYLRRFSRQLPLAYVTTTNRDMINLFFAQTGIGGYFTAGVALEDVAETKPSPEPYLKMLLMLKVTAGEAVVLEDSPAGISAAKGAGLFCLGITGSLPAEEISHADMLFPSTADACAWIAESYTLD